MIVCENVVKKFGGFPALDNISLSIEKGSIYGLVGSNGVGKSTLIRCIAGIYCPDSGKLEVGGEKVYENPSVKQKILMVADEPWFVQQADMRLMKQFSKRFYPDFSDEIYEELIHAFALPERKRISNFSKGM